jgi:hypothetical protein
MPVTRERVDPIRDPTGLELVHRRWIVPDEVSRPIALPGLSRLWHELLDLSVLDARQEVRLTRFGGADNDLPAMASPGALLAGAGTASFVTQVVWTNEEGIRDPYALEGEPDPDGFRDYTLYAIDSDSRLLLPLVPKSRLCAACGKRYELDLPRFGEGALLDLSTPCACGAAIDLGRDKGELMSGVVFLFEELTARAALSIELPSAPQSEELPDAAVAALLQRALGGTDELADDGVAPAQ